MKKAKRRKGAAQDGAEQNCIAGSQLVSSYRLFYPLSHAAWIRREENSRCPEDGLCFAYSDGVIVCNPNKRAEPAEWARAIAHCLLHLGMGHFAEHEQAALWNMACDCVAEKFLSDLKLGVPLYPGALPAGINDEERLYRRLCGMAGTAAGVAEYSGRGTAGESNPDMSLEPYGRYAQYGQGAPPQWEGLFAQGLSDAVRDAVKKAAGEMGEKRGRIYSRAERAREWFVSSYPLLGAIAANFRIIDDALVCQRMQISTAAVYPAMGEIYLNPAANLGDGALRFVMAHEFLHAALRHDARQEWRDAYIWNVACDFVINGWLAEMGVGERPDGLLHDEQFKGMSAEGVYDRIVADVRTYRKLATLRGVGLGDILGGDPGNGSGGGSGGRGGGLDGGPHPDGDVDLDAFYRRALLQGLWYHQQQGRGYLPAGLIEEIRALSHPPIPWDVELARWFEERFSPLEKRRSYARPSRRQSSTPDIPRPYWVLPSAALDGRTFGVVLDTSGSMGRWLLATALGA
ncbi:MAG: hypothetical protein LBJ10_03720, partial [Clostridiales bacterium]|nr:hypothetical protein [Clostridiales bacterium]